MFLFVVIVAVVVDVAAAVVVVLIIYLKYSNQFNTIWSVKNSNLVCHCPSKSFRNACNHRNLREYESEFPIPETNTRISFKV